MEGLITIEPEGVDETCYPAQPLPLALYPIEDRINTVLGKLSFIPWYNKHVFTSRMLR